MTTARGETQASRVARGSAGKPTHAHGLAGLVTERSLLLLGVVLFLLTFAAKEAGYYAGRRWHPRQGGDEPARTSVGIISGGMLALLAFLLAISLSIADRRYEERRTVVLAEANAIGTAWWRAGALDSEAGKTMQDLVTDGPECAYRSPIWSTS